MAASLIQCCRSNFFHSIPRNTLYVCLRREHSLATTNNNDNEPEYPPIKPKYPPGSEWGDMIPKVAWLWEGNRQEVHELKTAPEKIEHLTKDKFNTWKFPSIQYNPKLLNYQADKTKTLILKETDLGYEQSKLIRSMYKHVHIADDKDILKKLIIDAIELEHELDRRSQLQKLARRNNYLHLVELPSFEYELSHLASKNILHTIIGHLSGRYDHLYKCQIDENVNVAACWQRNGVERSPTMKPKKDPNFKPQNNAMFYAEHDVNFQIRKDKPLPEFLSVNDPSCQQLSYDVVNFKPLVLGQFRESMKRRINPGFNYGDPCEFNHLSVVLSNHRLLNYVKRKFGQECYEEARVGYGLSTSFISCVAQAHYLGFNMHEELTYPFTSQTIITDGREFIFTAYQLNTLLLWKDDEANRLQNLYWTNEPQLLYQKIENGKVVGFNDNTLDLLVKFIMIKPSDRDGIDLRPNLSPESSPLGKSVYMPNKYITETIEETIKFDRA